MTIGVNALQATYGTVFDYGNIADTICNLIYNFMIQLLFIDLNE